MDHACIVYQSPKGISVSKYGLPQAILLTWSSHLLRVVNSHANIFWNLNEKKSNFEKSEFSKNEKIRLIAMRL
jgi:hypothetical protein